MYNLLVSAKEDAWEGSTFNIDLIRCIREYTDEDITKKYGHLDTSAKDALQRFPCIFAYETRLNKPPKFGLIRKIAKQDKMVRIEYEIKPTEQSLTVDDLTVLASHLGIYNILELSRTHWAVKEIALAKELKRKGFILPAWMLTTSPVDITTHIFDASLSFPGETRSFVESIANELSELIGVNACFYDNNYVAQLARPSLDTLLRDIYRNRSKLIVVFLSGDYQRKKWCGVEFRVIQEIIMEREHKRIMFIKMDDEAVEGVLNTDGYIDGRKYTAHEIARFIQERLELLK
jgi:hypothetical protein